MNTDAMHLEGLSQRAAGKVYRELLSRQPLLTVFAGLMLALALVSAVGVKVAVYTFELVVLTTGSLKVPFVTTTSLAVKPVGASLKV